MPVSHDGMVIPEQTPVRSLLMLGGLACFGYFMPQAKADVFEISSAGEWKQINEQPAEQADEYLGDITASTTVPRLPPVKLAAITTVDNAVPQQSNIQLNSGAVTGQYGPLINAAAQQYGISSRLIDAVMWQESRYNHNAVSSAGAIGLMQLMPATARNLGVNPRDPWQNVFGGAAYLRKQLELFDNDVPLALAAYNAGPGAVIKYGGVPPYAETRNYVRVIMSRLMKQGQ